MSELLSSVVIGPAVAPKASVIWLHGLGADGYDFIDIVPQLNLPQNMPVRFIFPHAPVRPVTINNGYAMRAWFDIYNLSIPFREDGAGIRAAEQQIIQLIEHEEALGIPSAKIVLVGFSQGGALALYTGIRYRKKLAGLLGLSTFLPLQKAIAQEKNNVNQQTSIMLAHGTQDTVVPLQLGEMTYQALKHAGYPVTWHTYPMQHQVCLDEIIAIGRWLTTVLS